MLCATSAIPYQYSIHLLRSLCNPMVQKVSRTGDMTKQEIQWPLSVWIPPSPQIGQL